MYDEVFAAKGSPFLSAYDVVVGMDLDLVRPQHGELGFNTAEKAEDEIAKYLKHASTCANTPPPPSLHYSSPKESHSLSSSPPVASACLWIAMCMDAEVACLLVAKPSSLACSNYVMD